MAGGTTLSAFWILVLNSWMHTPAGYEMRDGVAYATDWWAIIFNPSMPYRVAHMLIASGLTVAFLLAGLSALRWIWNDRSLGIRKAMRTGVYLAACLIPIQILAGDLHGLNTLEHQPAKVAAMEGNWETQSNVPLVLFGIPDEAARMTHAQVGIPNGASLILKHSVDGVVPGLNDFIAEDGTIKHPPVAPVFWGFRIMVGIGLLMLIVSWYMSWQLKRQGYPTVWGARILVGMTFSGWIATLAGWYVTEIGRQPWLVNGLLLTESAVAPHPAPVLGISLAFYWFSFPNILLLAPIPLMSLAVILALHSLLKNMPTQKDRLRWLPFALTVALFLLAFFGLAYSFFPYVVPDKLTVWEAAAARESLSIILVGTLVTLPMIVTYTVFAYRVFGGKAILLSYE